MKKITKRQEQKCDLRKLKNKVIRRQVHARLRTYRPEGDLTKVEEELSQLCEAA